MSDIIVKFKPQGHKGLIDAIKKLELAQKGAAGATDKFGKSIGRNRKPMSIFENTMSTIRSRLLVYNFAMGMGIKQTIEFTKQAAKVADMSRAFTTLTGTGENAALSVSKISRAVKGTMSQMDLFKQANNAMILGVTRNTDEMAEMFQIAQTLGAALGVDTPQAVESLITGIGRQSRLMLDNIGIIVKADEAYESYAKKLKITKDDLTDAQKKQAFFTAAMESARAKAAELGNQQLTARDQFNKFNATMEDFTNFIGEKTSPIVLSFFNSFGEVLKRITETDLETSIRKLEEIGISAERLADLNRVLGLQEAREQIKQSQKEIDRIMKEIFIESGQSTVESFGAKVTEVFTDIGMDQVLRDFAIDPSNLNIDAIESALDRLKLTSEAAAIELAKAGQDEGYTEFLDNIIIKNAELSVIYNELLNQIDLMNQANQTTIQTNKELGETEEDNIDLKKSKFEWIKKLLDLELSSYAKLAAGMAALLGVNKKNALISARLDQSAALINTYTAVTDVLKEGTGPMRYVEAAAALAFGLAQVGRIEAQLSKMGGSGGGSTPQFAEGGYVGGRPHSQGGSIIEAERGEFVMSRNATESIGLETLNQMNQQGGAGNINISVTGNVLTQDFVEGELAESIKEAVRRGSDFGLS